MYRFNKFSLGFFLIAPLASCHKDESATAPRITPSMQLTRATVDGRLASGYFTKYKHLPIVHAYFFRTIG